MISKKYILFLGAMTLISCTSVQVPIDDAYYWPDKNVETAATPVTGTTSNPSPAPATVSETESKIVYTSVQDTAVTIRIKR